jgi:S-adenosylmethionine:tRNA ribosyltransferase-isomerase
MKREYINNDYWYDLPESQIAQAPANPRDASKLLVYNTQNNELIIDTFANLATHLPPSTTLTLNDARVVPARVTLTKETGGKIVVLFLINEWISLRAGPIPCFLDRKGEVGGRLYFPDRSFVTINSQDKELFYLSWGGSPDELLKKLDQYGAMPIPPYIKHSPLNRDEMMEKYQTIFARSPGSSAAPTASLHFTEEVFKKLERRGIKRQYITLHVGLGTFSPLTEENLRTKTLHKETYEVPTDVVGMLKAKSLKLKAEHDITAVGTTVVRTLESLANRQQSMVNSQGIFTASTDLFISPPHEFKAVDHLITNFHLPGSSLMMLVDAFLEHKKAKKRILELYSFAMKNNFRFYSFGDAMLIL